MKHQKTTKVEEKWGTERRAKEGDVAQFVSFSRRMDKLRLGKWTTSACDEKDMR